MHTADAGQAVEAGVPHHNTANGISLTAGVDLLWLKPGFDLQGHGSAKVMNHSWDLLT